MLRSLGAATTIASQADGGVVLSGPAPARLLLRRMDDAPAGSAAPCGFPALACSPATRIRPSVFLVF